MFLAAFFVQHELNKQQQDMTSQPEAITFGLAFCLGRGLGGVFGWGISSVGGVVGCRTSAANRSGMGMVCGGGEGRGSGGGGGGGGGCPACPNGRVGGGGSGLAGGGAVAAGTGLATGAAVAGGDVGAGFGNRAAWIYFISAKTALNSCMSTVNCCFMVCQVSASRLSYFAVSQSLRADLQCHPCTPAAPAP